MPKERTPGLPQINAGQALYGEMPIELLPAGPPMDQTNLGVAIAAWDGVQWHISRLIGGGGLDISYNAAENVVEVYYSSNRVYQSFISDAILLGTLSGSFTADAVLV